MNNSDTSRKRVIHAYVRAMNKDAAYTALCSIKLSHLMPDYVSKEDKYNTNEIVMIRIVDELPTTSQLYQDSNIHGEWHNFEISDTTGKYGEITIHVNIPYILEKKLNDGIL